MLSAACPVTPARRFPVADPIVSAAAPQPSLRDSAIAVAGASRLPLTRSDVLPTWARRGLTGGVVLVHLLGVWALMQVDAVRQVVLQTAPIMVDLISPPAPPPPLPPPPAPPQRALQKPRPADPPLIAAAPSPTQAPAFVSPPEPVAPQAVAVASPPAPGPVQVAPPPPAPPALKQVPAGAVRYLVEPKLVVPLLSRRAGEQGLVHLRVVVDARGQLREASVKKSSGFARLDNQALIDIRSARFAPQTENGQPVEWETTALLSYELDQ